MGEIKTNWRIVDVSTTNVRDGRGPVLFEIDLTQDEGQHLIEFLRAFDIYVERNSKRDSLWRKFGWRDSLMHMRSKMERVFVMLRSGRPEEFTGTVDDMDDLYDLLNYTVFCIRNLKDNNENGDFEA